LKRLPENRQCHPSWWVHCASSYSVRNQLPLDTSQIL